MVVLHDNSYNDDFPHKVKEFIFTVEIFRELGKVYILNS